MKGQDNNSGEPPSYPENSESGSGSVRSSVLTRPAPRRPFLCVNEVERRLINNLLEVN